MRQSNDFRDSDCASWRWHEWARIYTAAGIAVLLCLPAYLFVLVRDLIQAKQRLPGSVA